MLRPGCTPCQKYGTTCPGYTRSRKFLDEGPHLHQRFGQSRTQTVSPSTTTPTESIDELISPSLVAQSLTKQQPVIFGTFVLTAFSRWFGLNKFRVHVPWTAYIAENTGSSPAFDAAITSLNAIFMSHTHTDLRLQRTSREMYTQALRLFGARLRGLANKPAPKRRPTDATTTRESISITIALSLFEAYSRTNPDSWARHAGATALLMAHRGAAAHRSGFDRCLYLSFRSFLVAEAFITGKRCLFETLEWQTHIDEIRGEDMASPRVDAPIAVFIDLQDRIFAQVVQVPGLLVAARRVCLASEPWSAALALAADARRCSQVLCMLAARLRVAAAAGHSGSGKIAPFIGPMPSSFPQEFANSVLRGSEICLYILRLLLDYLGSVTGRDENSRANEKSNDLELDDPLPFRIVSKLARQDQAVSLETSSTEGSIPPADKWLDQVAASMGLEAFDIITYARDTQ